jgi:hypothetical protein
MLTMDFSEAPTDPIERIVWLSGVQEVVDRELNAAFQKAYFEARQTGRLDAALRLGYHSHKKVMGYTRHENERRGRMLKWGDGR